MESGKFIKQLMRVVCLSLIIILTTLFVFYIFKKKPIEYSTYYELGISSTGEFYPYGFRVFQSREEMMKYYNNNLNSVNLEAINNLFRYGCLDFEKYTYINVEGARIREMYISTYYTISNGIYTNWWQSLIWLLKDQRHPLYIDYFEPDYKRYLYVVKKDTHLRSHVF